MHSAWNNTFKRPTGPRPHTLRSPSPPRAFVEPISPEKPQPLEPQWQYPAVTALDFTAKSEQPLTETPRPRAASSSHKHGHHRTPSTIDTLADAALATSPTFQSHSRKSSTARDGFNFPPPPPPRTGYGGEPPHKRARSEVLPMPYLNTNASRPATSYQPNGWSPSGAPVCDSRVEEAALLLNFRTGGWPSNSPPVPTALSPTVPRPHANSFPQDAHQLRPLERASNGILLPPFHPQNEQHPQKKPSHLPHTANNTMPNGNHESLSQQDVVMQDAHPFAAEQLRLQTEHVFHSTDSSSNSPTTRSHSTDVSLPDAPGQIKNKRGWPKGKPRGPSSRKSLAEKATKKANSRKKTPDARAAKKAEVSVFSEAADERAKKPRRKSFNGSHTNKDATPSKANPRAQSVPRDVVMIVRGATKPVKRHVKTTPETICAACSTSRAASKSHGEMDEWISCNGCKNWFHIDCAGFKKAHEIRDVDKFFCNACEPEHGKTTYVRKSSRAHASVDYAELQKGVLKTSEESVEHHYIQPIKDGTFQFDPEEFPRMRAEDVTRDFFEKNLQGGFTEPICIPAAWNSRPWTQPDEKNKVNIDLDDDSMAGGPRYDYESNPELNVGEDGIGMVMPADLSVRQVCNLVGPDTPLDVIDVKTQNSGSKWTLAKWADYYEEDSDDKEIRNVISLEVSQTKLGRLLRRPKLVRDIDLQDSVWPREETDKGKFPKVQFYCLMSVADSYTDFHIDFGGSSVYYHILKGKKTFFFIPPKPKHLKAYEEWNDSPQQNFTFLPHITKECYRVDLHEGDTMLIPSGWIHAVWTPATSLVIGGNFLNRMSYKNQFRVVEIEKNNETPMKFRYPFFQKIMWYTALQYLREDPMPQEVSELFYEGKQFDRQVAIWQDYDGQVAANDQRIGAKNARYYSQSEVEGLPDLVNFIFRTVMVVMGRVEGTSADRIRRVNMSIPKGHGEPLEIAKTFALWVTWKRGNEDPPAWAHPDAVLPNSKEEGTPKKLSARALKEMERKEAIAAWRAAPDRQSARVLAKSTAAAAQATPIKPHEQPQSRASTPPPSQLQPPHLRVHQHQSFAPPVPSPAADAPSAMTLAMYPGQYVSTPKTSVLGPKRVACDACRKRRIRCKHKDMVMQLDATSSSPYGMALDPSFHSPQFYENTNGTPQRSGDGSGSFPTSANGTPIAGGGATNGHGPLPGTNAYISANIPMALNGIAMFGDATKRGRSKACFECRKSKRRCVHDENGNVDPVKAAETPIPRGSVPSKKRQSFDDQNPSQVVKKQKSVDFDRPPPPYHMPTPESSASAVFSQAPTFQSNVATSDRTEPLPSRSHEPTQPPIDPSLFSLYSEPSDNGYANSHYPYHGHEQQQTFAFPSLEQIANEVLDMDGKHHDDPPEKSANGLPPQVSAAHAADDLVQSIIDKTDGSVDSAVSLLTAESAEAIAKASANGTNKATSSLEVKQPEAHVDPALHTGSSASENQAASNKTEVNNLPLYRPPAPLSVSPELSKRRPSMNGFGSTTPHKRKRDSVSGSNAPLSAKKTRINGVGESPHKAPQETEDERLARLLQQDDLGLRRRGS
ncbi:Putative zn(2)-C6 fungal-type DNA-binding domain, Zinc finger, PHD-type, JmjC [Acrodontium crateriforme]|uniref:JmjC domain-containing histone demethylation protein 1 n=1 Tax=Acrodontium crateriforme TaxID=150365 RepID=A0AAQ3M2G1_9PEZI|nr:Putative zn(2)-C6 fungal-type DNA-binding domain, Zinc finger, PHD-type, JmjC [Acrodontium crateriforme]